VKIKAHTFFAGLIFFILLPILLSAQETEVNEEEEIEEIEEAPSTLWSYQMGDNNVDIYWDGYWTFQFAAGLAVEIDGDDFDWSTSYDDYTNGLYFAQTPDLLLSLWIDDRYFLEVSVADDYDNNTYLMGYQGADNEYLQSVKIGNTSITTDSYAGMTVTTPEYSAPGITIKGDTGRMQNEFMIRFEGTWEDSKTYIGSYEADEEYIELYEYLDNRKFVLPDADVDSDDLLVYIRDDDGDYDASTSSYSYTLAEEGDYLLDSDNGILTIEDDETGPIAIYYTVRTDEIGDSALGKDSVIPPTATDSGVPDVDSSAVDFNWSDEDPYDTQDGTWWESRGETIDGNACLLIYEPNRFSPFAMYSRYSYSLSLSSNSWQNDLNLADRNEDETDAPSDFSWEADTSDKIITLYRSDSDDRDALNRYPLGDTHPEVYGNAPYSDSDLVSEQLQLISKSSSSGYSLGTGVVSGSITITVNGVTEYNYSLDSDTGEITFNRYIYPDDRIVITYRREYTDFEGQEMLIYQGNRLSLSDKDTLELAESFNWVFPDGTDYSTPDGGTLTVGTSWEHESEFFTLTTELTGEADFGDADGLQSVLGMEDAITSYGVYEDALAEPKAGEGETDNEYDEDDYVVMNDGDGPLEEDSDGSSYFDDTYMMAAEFTLSNDDDWTGADLHLTSSDTADYSTLQEISFYIKVTDGTPGDLVLKLGETGEYEDFDDDDYVADYDESLVATEVIDYTDFNSSTWTQVTWELDSDDRQCLTSTRSLRFIFAGTDGGIDDVDDTWAADTYQVYIGGLELVGQTFAISETDSDDSMTVSQTEEEDDDLESAYSDEIDQFHSDDDDDQLVAKISWEGMTSSSDKWEAVSWIDAQDPTEFGKLIFFVKNGTTDGTYSMEFTDTDEEGIVLSWEPTSTDWQKVTIDLTEETATFDDGAENVSLSIDNDVTSLSRVYFSGEGIIDDSYLSVDEIYFEESILALNGKVVVDLDYDKAEILTGESGFQWLENYSLDLTGYGSATTRTGGIAQEEGSASFEVQTGLDIMYLGVSLQGDGSWDDGDTAFWWGHGLEFPSCSSPVKLEETYSIGDDSSTPLLSHTAALEINLADKFSLEGDHDAVLEQDELDQDWSSSLELNGEKWSTELAGDWSIESDEEALHDSGYFTVWADSWSYIVPDTTDVDDRTASIDFTTEYNGSILSPELSVSLETELDYSSDWEQTNSLTTTLSCPISLKGKSSFTLTPSYSRTLERTEEIDYTGSYSDDYWYWGYYMLPILPLTNFIPFWELADGDGDDVFNIMPSTGSYSYTPEFGLTLSRNYGSQLLDLFLPAEVEATFSRLYEGETDSEYYENSWDFSLQQRALNLFGSFGVNPRFSFYTTEEISNTYTLSLEEINTSIPAAESFSWNCYNRFEGENGSTLTIENDLSFELGDSTTEQFSGSYSWKRERKDYRKIPFTKYIIDQENYVENTEEIYYEYSYDEDDDDRVHEISVSHESALYLTDLGVLTGTFQFGIEQDGDVTTLGSEVSVELQLTF
jgi:hypothetical protein